MPYELQEAHIGSIFAHFEERGVSFYLAEAHGCVTQAKTNAMEQLSRYRDQRFEEVPLLKDAIATLYATWYPDNKNQCLLLQGVVLERIGEALYTSLQESDVSQNMRGLCVAGAQAAREANTAARNLLRPMLAEQDSFRLFVRTASPLLEKLDSFGSAIEDAFADTLQIELGEVAGSLTANLVTDCVDLGMEKRKVFGLLTEAFMGNA